MAKIPAGILSIPLEFLESVGLLWNSWILAGFCGFQPESVEEWKVLEKEQGLLLLMTPKLSVSVC
jgi:hypothetical protein